MALTLPALHGLPVWGGSTQDSRVGSMYCIDAASLVWLATWLQESAMQSPLLTHKRS